MSAVRHLSIDIETFSSVDITKGGLYKYAQALDFEILLLAYAYDDGPVFTIDLMKCETKNDTAVITALLADLRDPTIIKHAYNAAFEWYCLNQAGFETPLDQWRCTMLHGLYCGYPAGLSAVGEAVGLPKDKQKLSTGRALIRTFCVPRKPTKNNSSTRVHPHNEPEKWQLFMDYCRQDVEAEREVARRLLPWPVPESEQAQWVLDVHTNAHGVAVDMELVQGALSVSDTITEELMAEAVQLTGLDNPKSVAQLKAWLEEEIDEDIGDLRKETVVSLLSSVESEKARLVLQLRQELGKSSVSKYAAIERSVCDDGRVRGLLMFYGANRTGRWAGRVVQVQNLPQNHLDTLDYARHLVKRRDVNALKLMYGNVPATLSQLIRTALVPSPGRRFIVADYSAIEARVIAWLAGEQWRLDVFATHGKIYEASASQMFGVELSKITKGNPEYALRQKGKVAELALGYGGSVGALEAMGALKMGLSEDELPEIVRLWRAASPAITRLWYKLEQAALAALKGQSGSVFATECSVNTDQQFLTMTLPSGRKLFYARPFIAPGKFDKDALHYMGNDQKSGKWAEVQTFGGKLAENAVQAIARDCLALTLMKLHRAGYEVVFSVHDEVVIDATPDQKLDDVLQIMREPIPWAPGLLLSGAGFECEYYMKD